MHLQTGSRGRGGLHCSRTVHSPHTALYMHPQTCCSGLRGVTTYQQAGTKRRTTIHARAQPGPDRGSVAALEAAIGAINNILGTYNKVKGGKSASGGKQNGTGNTSSKQSPAAAPAGPSKLVTFSAKASSSVPVKVQTHVSLLLINFHCPIISLLLTNYQIVALLLFFHDNCSFLQQGQAPNS